jgi:hypothetical protein
MTGKAAMIGYKWQTKQQSSDSNGWQRSNDQLRMADKAAIICYTWLTKQ